MRSLASLMTWKTAVMDMCVRGGGLGGISLGHVCQGLGGVGRASVMDMCAGGGGWGASVMDV